MSLSSKQYGAWFLNQLVSGSRRHSGVASFREIFEKQRREGLKRDVLNDVILGLAKDGTIALHATDLSRSMREDEDRWNFFIVKDRSGLDGEKWYIGAAIREDNPKVKSRKTVKKKRNPSLKSVKRTVAGAVSKVMKAGKRVLGRKRNTTVKIKRAVVLANGRKRRNPKYTIEATPKPGIQTFTHTFDNVPGRTAVAFKMRAILTDAGQNPNAFTYEITKLGGRLGRYNYRVKAKPKVVAKKETVKAFTGGAALRKFKKTLKGPTNAYEISIEKNPAQLRTSREAFALAGKISRKVEELRAKGVSDRELSRWESRLKRVFVAAERLRQKEEDIQTAPYIEAIRRQTSAPRRGGMVKKATARKPAPVLRASKPKAISVPAPPPMAKMPKTSRTAFALAGKISRKIEELKARGISDRDLARWEARLQKVFTAAEKMRQKEEDIETAPYREALRRQTSAPRRNPKRKTVKRRRNASSTAIANRKKFAGSFRGFKKLFFPRKMRNPGSELSTLGPIISITTTDFGKITPPQNSLYLCQDDRDKLYIGTPRQGVDMVSGPARSYGKIKQIEYLCAKPHLGKEYAKTTQWYHDFERPLPELKGDGEGGLHIVGGSFKILREGITG